MRFSKERADVINYLRGEICRPSEVRLADKYSSCVNLSLMSNIDTELY